MTTTSPSLLVAGGRGFIGRYVVEAAERAGYAVTTLGRSPGNDIVRDLRLPGLAVGGFDYLINLAAYSDHAATGGLDAYTVCTDSARMLRLLQGSYRRAIHVSTSEVFGDRRDERLGWARVDDPYRLESLYAQGKAEQEQSARLYGMHVVRITNVWGEGQPATKAYPAIRRAVLDGQPVTDRTGGAPVQWSHVAAVATGLVEMLTSPTLRRHEHLAPAGTRTLTEFVTDIAGALDCRVPPIQAAEPLAARLGIVPTVPLGSTLVAA